MRPHRRLGRTRWSITVATAIATALAFAATAVAGNGGELGGPPTTDLAETQCPDGTAVTALTGELSNPGGNTVVATINLVCEGGADPTGEELGNSAENAETGTGSTTCPAGQVAVGIVGQAGDFIDQIALRCQDDSLTGPITTALPYGGTGGGPEGPFDCPAGQQLVGLSGSEEFGATGTLVKHVEIVCADRAGQPQARCAGRDATIAGSPGRDVLVGTTGDDVITGLGGKDKIRGLGGDDRLCGKGGKDKLKGGGGKDKLKGGKKPDKLSGGGGRDKCAGGGGDDTAKRCEIEKSV